MITYGANDKRTLIELIKPHGFLYVPRVFISKLGGSVSSAIFLAQLIDNWAKRGEFSGEFFSHSYAQWKQETGLSQHEVKRITGILKDLGLITTKLARSGGAPTLHYRVNTDILIAFFSGEKA